MQRNLIVLHPLPVNRGVSAPVKFFTKIFNDGQYKEILLKDYKFNTITSLDIIHQYGKSEKEFCEYIKNEQSFSNSIILAIQTLAVSRVNIIERANNIKFVGWLNDPHHFAEIIENRETTIQKYIETYDSHVLDKIDYLITPSSIYFDNLKMKKYYDKIVDLFYCLDPEWFLPLSNRRYHERDSKIILSGAFGEGYKSRSEFYDLKTKSSEFDALIHRIKHPGYKNNDHMTGVNYYNKLSEFKAAFVGHHDFPLNFLLAKHIEVLMCGCLGFFEPNRLLYDQLGLIESEHYVSNFKEGCMIDNYSFYYDWINSERGREVSRSGQKYVMEKFGKQQINKLFDILEKCAT